MLFNGRELRHVQPSTHDQSGDVFRTRLIRARVSAGRCANRPVDPFFNNSSVTFRICLYSGGGASPVITDAAFTGHQQNMCTHHADCMRLLLLIFIISHMKHINTLIVSSRFQQLLLLIPGDVHLHHVLQDALYQLL